MQMSDWQFCFTIKILSHSLMKLLELRNSSKGEEIPGDDYLLCLWLDYTILVVSSSLTDSVSGRGGDELMLD